MSRESCGECPTLRAQINQLTRQLEHVQMQLSGLRAVTAGQVRFIHAELEPGEATMQRDKVLRRVEMRLTEAVVEAGGRV